MLNFSTLLHENAEYAYLKTVIIPISNSRKENQTLKPKQQW